MTEDWEDFEDDGAAQFYALRAIANALRDLGNGNATTNMGAIEAHGLAVKEGLQELASAMADLASAIRERD